MGDPWISVTDISRAAESGDILYGEGSAKGPEGEGSGPIEGGDVYIRKAPPQE